MRQWRALRALSEPQRRSAYEFVCAHAGAVTRDDVAAGVGMSRALAAFHLDKLVDAGLLEAATGGVPGGGKVGRPAKTYRRSDVQIDLSLPARRYDIGGRVLARALQASVDGESPVDAVNRVAREQGSLIGGSARPAAARQGHDRHPLGLACRVLDGLGYSPMRHDGEATLANCPFRALVEVAPELTCRMNHALIDGLIAGAGVAPDVTTSLEPGPGRCCVTLAVSSTPAPATS